MFLAYMHVTIELVSKSAFYMQLICVSSRRGRDPVVCRLHTYSIGAGQGRWNMCITSRRIEACYWMLTCGLSRSLWMHYITCSLDKDGLLQDYITRRLSRSGWMH